MIERLVSFCWFLSFAVTAIAQVPLEINGITDRLTAMDSASFWVPVASGHSYLVLLDGKPVPAVITNVVNAAEYHEVTVWRTNVLSQEVTNRSVRFIVNASSRGMQG